MSWAEGRGGWAELRAETVIHEDATALVLNKPAGISVMGERHGTDLVRMAEEAGETLFPVHRIDKATSGAILFAKELRFHGDLTRQFNRRTVGKAYLAITRSAGLPERGTIDLPLTVGRKNRVRVAGNRADILLDEASSTWTVTSAEPEGTRSYPSTTRFVRVWSDARNTLLALSPLTGRRHQIRVHLAWIGHPIQGDPLFESVSASTPEAGGAGGRTYLHSWRLAFDSAAPDGGGPVRVAALPGPDFWTPIRDRLPDDLAVRLAQAERLAAPKPPADPSGTEVADRPGDAPPAQRRPRPRPTRRRDNRPRR